MFDRLNGFVQLISVEGTFHYRPRLLRKFTEIELSVKLTCQNFLRSKWRIVSALISGKFYKPIKPH